MSEPRVVTDYDEWRVTEGPELHLRGTGLSPYPATPPPRPRPADEEG